MCACRVVVHRGPAALLVDTIVVVHAHQHRVGHERVIGHVLGEVLRQLCL